MAVALTDRHATTPWSRRAIFTGRPLRARDEADFWIRVSRTAMACRFEVTLAAQDAGCVPAARDALNGIDAIEDQLSLFRGTSGVTELNRRAASEPVVVDEQFFDLLSLCAAIHHDTQGAFDITSTPLSRCWGFLQRHGRLPSAETIEQALSQVGFGYVRLDPAARSVRFTREGVELNFGAIGKGYGLDRVASGMRAAGVRHALLSAGRSSLLAIGGRDGGWHIDVASPRATGALARVFLHDAAVGTSGSGEQFVLVDGVRYGHVLDPRNGWPAAGVLSATVIASNSATADALSTAFLIGGARLAHAYCASHMGVMALITPEDSRHTILVGHHPGALVEEA